MHDKELERTREILEIVSVASETDRWICEPCQNGECDGCQGCNGCPEASDA